MANLTNIIIASSSTNTQFDPEIAIRQINRVFANKLRQFHKRADAKRVLIETDFCYLMDDVMRGFPHQRPIAIQRCYDFIAAKFPEQQPAVK